MVSERSESTTREQRLDEIIAAYVQAVEAGQAPDRQQLLSRHLDLAAELATFFADQDRFDRLAAPLRAMSPMARREALGNEEDPAVNHTATPAPGTRVGYFGDYELLEEIARGGMGIVYKARQRSLRRVVALKMIRATPTVTATEVRRFQGEAEAVANLDHPHIVPIYEVGEFQGQHYFSMKLIEGGNLTEHMPRLAADPRAIAWLLATVARTVHYAHQRGLLHRDLKPANILIDAQGQPHVTDFGLAKRLLGDAKLTQTGDIVGTPCYMAPEQASGPTRELSTAVDVYSLGAILYEMLTSRPPFKADTPLDTLRQVTDQEPVRPRALNPHVNRDLETICLKCLEKEPRQRYTSAEALADDLQRFLEDRPIRARRPTLIDRARKWTRRHKAVVVAAVLLWMLASVGLVASTVLVWRERQRAEAERQRAEANFQQARQAVDQMLTHVAESQLLDVSHTETLRRELLEHALQYYQAFLKEKGTDPEVRLDTVNAYRRLGDIQQQLGQSGEAEEAYRQAIAQAEKLVADHPNVPEYQTDLARNYHSLGTLLRTNGKLQEAEQAYRKAFAINEKLAADHPNVPEYRQRLARGQNDLGALLAATGRHKEAEHAYRQALTLQEKLATDFPAQPGYLADLALTYVHLGPLLQATGRPQEAEQAYRKALTLQEKLLADFPAKADYRRDLATTYAQLGSLLRDTGRLQEAERTYQQALTLQQKLVADFPKMIDYQADLGTTYLYLGRLQQAAGRIQEAEQYFRRALALQQKRAADFPKVPDYRKQLAVTYRDLGTLMALTGRLAEAEVSYRQALALLEKLVSDFPAVTDHLGELAATMNNLANLYRNQGKLAEAQQMLRGAINLLEAVLKSNPQHPTHRRSLRVSYEHLAEALMQTGDHAEAVRCAEVLSRVVPEEGLSYRRAAGIAARCTALAEQDAKLPEAQRKAVAQKYADQAMAWLGEALKKGFKGVEQLKKDRDLESLRTRDDFKKLVDEFEKASPDRR
jgi:tetratricopeptide (TPR) repeat protein/tRNA A-37 threonylcarbamoyl transferase component Bud32